VFIGLNDAGGSEDDSSKWEIRVKGILLDYKEGLKGKGFAFTNPNASSTCGCGESFSV
jgi:iron-sulfur cluster assembly protein